MIRAHQRAGSGVFNMRICLFLLLSPEILTRCVVSFSPLHLKEEVVGLISARVRNTVSRLHGFISLCWSWLSFLFNTILASGHSLHVNMLIASSSSSFFHAHTPRHVQAHAQANTHTDTRMHTHCWIYGSLESGLLMERLPLINASFNDRLLKTGRRMIVCFSSYRVGKKWNDVEIYGICPPVRQNY